MGNLRLHFVENRSVEAMVHSLASMFCILYNCIYELCHDFHGFSSFLLQVLDTHTPYIQTMTCFFFQIPYLLSYHFTSLSYLSGHMIKNALYSDQCLQVEV